MLLNSISNILVIVQQATIRGDATKMGWQGDYLELFNTAGDYNLCKEITDITINGMQPFHNLVVEHL